MHPILFKFTIAGSEKVIGSYGLLMLAAFAAAFLIARRLSKRPPFSGSFPTDVLFLLIAFGLAGAYAAGLLLFMPELISGNMSLTTPVFISWGGILGGVSAALISAKVWKIPLPDFADLCAPAYLTGIGIGRIGCFLGGCCFGVHTDSAIGVVFSNMAVPAGAAIQPIVPVQLISFAYLAGGGAVFSALYLKNAPAGGRLFAFSALFYSTGRFIIEFWRDDYRVFFAGLSDGQFFSLCFFAAGCIILFRTRKNAKVNSSG